MSEILEPETDSNRWLFLPSPPAPVWGRTLLDRLFSHHPLQKWAKIYLPWKVSNS